MANTTTWRKTWWCLCLLVSGTVASLLLLLSLASNSSWTAESQPWETQSLQRGQDPCKYSATHWEKIQSFLEACQEAELDIFLAEPAPLMEIEAGKTDPCLWAREAFGPVVTFGVVEPSNDALGSLLRDFNSKTAFDHHVTYDVNPHGVSARFFMSMNRFPIVLVHFLVWSRDHGKGEDDATPLLFHLIVFYRRGDYLWLAQLSAPSETTTWSNKLPFPVSQLSFGQNAALIRKFVTRKQNIGGVNVAHPVTIPSFLRDLRESALVECNHETARHMITYYRKSLTVARSEFRKQVLTALAIATRTLDKLGLTFWLGSGTLLGWYRQCDVIPYTTDVDLEMRIEDYTPNITTALTAAGLHQIRQFGQLNDSFQLGFKLGVRLDIYFHYQETNYSWTALCDPKSFEKYRCNYRKFSLRWAEFAGLRVRVPYPPEVYLKTAYGKRWRYPDTGYHYLASPLNCVPAGVWPESEKARAS